MQTIDLNSNKPISYEEVIRCKKQVEHLVKLLTTNDKESQKNSLNLIDEIFADMVKKKPFLVPVFETTTTLRNF